MRDETGGTNTKITTLRNDQGTLKIGTHNDAYGGFSEKLTITSGGKVNVGGDYTQTSYQFSITDTGGNLFRIKTANEGDYDLRFMI